MTIRQKEGQGSKHFLSHPHLLVSAGALTGQTHAKTNGQGSPSEATGRGQPPGAQSKVEKSGE